MSTKIYNSFRVSKKVDIMKLLQKFKKIAIEVISKDKDHLYAIHAYSVALAVKVEANDHNAKQVVEESKKNEFGFDTVYWIQKKMQEAALIDIRNAHSIIMDVKFSVSVGWDKRYYYLKFFPNGIGVRFMNAIEKRCKELEDFHYQNSCDPPKNIPYRQYKLRDKKWEELTAPEGNYRNMLSYNIFDDIEFYNLLSKNWWTGQKDLYKHLAYKFDKKIETNKKPETGK